MMTYAPNSYRLLSHCWERPIDSTPGAWINVLERRTDDWGKTHQLTGTSRRVLNLGSYNYLGFAQRSGPIIDEVALSIDEFSPSLCCPRTRYGTTRHHVELEETVADFLGKDAAMIFGMGFATNSSTLPALLVIPPGLCVFLCFQLIWRAVKGPGGLIISDSLNHRSLVIGSRSSHAHVRVFRHNDLRHLEEVIRHSISTGQPKTRWPWKKIFIIVEGIYSMEGDICLLPQIVALKKKYKCYLYLDEAHSIGALGKTGRGVTEHLGSLLPACLDSSHTYLPHTHTHTPTHGCDRSVDEGCGCDDGDVHEIVWVHWRIHRRHTHTHSLSSEEIFGLTSGSAQGTRS